MLLRLRSGRALLPPWFCRLPVSNGGKMPYRPLQFMVLETKSCLSCYCSAARQLRVRKASSQFGSSLQRRWLRWQPRACRMRRACSAWSSLGRPTLLMTAFAVVHGAGGCCKRRKDVTPWPAACTVQTDARALSATMAAAADIASNGLMRCKLGPSKKRSPASVQTSWQVMFCATLRTGGPVWEQTKTHNSCAPGRQWQRQAPTSSSNSWRVLAGSLGLPFVLVYICGCNSIR
mmetsp:Transcript_3264/g.7260  ORF Transcript_3264/g.7260 Transcript_3264/m.7260 type:complete len:233 (-) Transcript_3264:878-1576(-)